MKITAEQLKQIIKEELNEMMEMDSDIWSMVEELKLGGMTESGIMIELDKMYTAGAAGPAGTPVKRSDAPGQASAQSNTALKNASALQFWPLKQHGGAVGVALLGISAIPSATSGVQ